MQNLVQLLINNEIIEKLLKNIDIKTVKRKIKKKYKLNFKLE